MSDHFSDIRVQLRSKKMPGVQNCTFLKDKGGKLVFNLLRIGVAPQRWWVGPVLFYNKNFLKQSTTKTKRPQSAYKRLEQV
jgi:hypothetical protein